MTRIQDDYSSRLNAPWHDIQGHMEYLKQAVASRVNPVVVELGTRSGNSTAALLAGCEESGGTLWSCDIDSPEVPAWWHELPYWSFLEADDISAKALDAAPHNIDVLFIDTSHEYNQTLAELFLYVPRVSKSGIVLCHDTQWLSPATDTGATEGCPVSEALNVYSTVTPGFSWTNRAGFYGLGVSKL
jgi:predicted O-methyltransferase YrrM